MKTILWLVFFGCLSGCSHATANSPREGAFPMWADSQCWGAKSWAYCRHERKEWGVGEGRFVLARDPVASRR